MQTSRGHTMARGEAVTSPQGQSGGVPRRPLAAFAKGLLAGRKIRGNLGIQDISVYPHKYHPPRCQGTVFPIRTLTLAQKTF